MDDFTEAIKATKETMEAAEEVTAATVDLADVGQKREDRQVASTLFLVQPRDATSTNVSMDTITGQG